MEIDLYEHLQRNVETLRKEQTKILLERIKANALKSNSSFSTKMMNELCFNYKKNLGLFYMFQKGYENLYLENYKEQNFSLTIQEIFGFLGMVSSLNRQKASQYLNQIKTIYQPYFSQIEMYDSNRMFLCERRGGNYKIGDILNNLIVKSDDSVLKTLENPYIRKNNLFSCSALLSFVLQYNLAVGFINIDNVRVLYPIVYKNGICLDIYNNLMLPEELIFKYFSFDSFIKMDDEASLFLYMNYDEQNIAKAVLSKLYK